MRKDTNKRIDMYDLDAPGTVFSYQSYVKKQEMMRSTLVDIFETNTGVK